MSIVSYAQNFEDVLLWRALHDVEQGRYLDIGAQDPVVDSVSLAFYQAGWRGVHVEPTSFYAAKLREARPDETVIEAAVSNFLGSLEFHEFPDTGLSTGKVEIAQKHVQSGFEVRKILVPTVRLDRLLEQIGEVQWMKIDVEGMEADVLASWGDNPARPWIIVIEATVPNTQVPTDHEWRDMLIQRGYCHVHFDGLSRYFVHESHAALKSLFAAPPNVFDQFAVGRHHFSAALVRAELETSEQRVRDQAAEVVRLNEELLATTHRQLREQGERELSLRHTHEKDLLETRWREREAVTEELRHEGRETEQALRQSVAAAEAAAAGARAELARLEERTAQLQDKLSRADDESKRAEERLAETQRQIAVAHREAAEAQVAATIAREERDRAQTTAEKVETERGIALAEAHDSAERMRSAFERDVEHYRDALAEADGLIRWVVAEPHARWQRIGEALGLARPSQARQALAGWSPPAASDEHAKSMTYQPTINGTEPIMYRSAPTEARNPYLRANSLPELLSWHDADFVRCAYVTVLGRQPDAEGEAYYTDRIRRGHSKLELLWQLRRSPEGPRHDPGIAGFDRALKRARWVRNRVFGWLAKASHEEGDNRADRRHRALINELFLLKESYEAGGRIIAQRLDRLAGHPAQSDQCGPLAAERQAPSGHASAVLETAKARLSPKALKLFRRIAAV